MRKWWIFLVLVCGCQVNEADAPELLTQEAQQIGSDSVVMGGELKEIGPVVPVNFGFLWDATPDLTIVTAKNKVIVGSTSEKRLFSIKQGTLLASTPYYYRAFAANADYSKFYYGNVVTFTTLP